MKGRHFGFLCILCASWVSTRVAVLSVAAIVPANERLQTPYSLTLNAVPVTLSVRHERAVAPASADPKYGFPMPTHEMSKQPARVVIGTTLNQQWRLPPLPASDIYVAPEAPINSGLSITPGEAILRQNNKRLQIYAYSFWRNGGGSNRVGLAQYGGGQSGVIATYRVTSRISLLARGAVAHDRIREREVAGGLRWLPIGNPAIALTAERRIRNGRGDAYATYISGGKSAMTLPMDFKLDAFGQAGYVSGAGGGPFFDAQARTTREYRPFAQQSVRLGAGLWAGGQEGAARLDIGPTIGTDVKVGETSIRVDADWRWRVAGDARPASGPALTLSTSF